MVEYALILGIVVVLGSAALAFTPVGDAVADQSVDVAAAIGGEPASPEATPGPTPSSGSSPGSTNDCKQGGWQGYGFSNQGACVSWYNANS